MFNESPNEMRNIQREIDRTVDEMIALLPREEQTTIIRKEAERREKTRIDTTLLEAKKAALENELEALEAEIERRRKRKLQEWHEQIAELEQLLTRVSEGEDSRLLFRHMIELMFEGCQEMATSQERVELMKKIDEKRNEILAPFDKELDELAEKMIAHSDPEKRDEIRKAMGERRAKMRMTPPHIDFVTGVNNTRFFNEVVTSEIERADRHQLPLTILCIDIDHFRRVNDTYGHVAGNDVLRAVADLVRSSVRRTDLVFRSGGDEFTVLLPGTGGEGGRRVAEYIRHSIATSELLASAGQITVTVAACEYELGESRRAFLARAEEALSRAKRDRDDGLKSLRRA
jgi:diguanylate cyclase (GGDEF)-like protein